MESVTLIPVGQSSLSTPSSRLVPSSRQLPHQVPLSQATVGSGRVIGPQSLASGHCDVQRTLSFLAQDIPRSSVVIKDSVLARGPFPSPYLLTTPPGVLRAAGQT